MARIIISLVYFVVVNLYSLFRVGADRDRTMHGGCVIPTRSFFLVAMCGGSIGTLMGMYLFKHKTDKLFFKLGMFLVLTVQLVFAAVTYLRYGLHIL